MCLYLYIINYTLTFYFPCIIKLKVSLGREKCIEHCRGCRSGDMAWPGRGGARRGQWGKFGVAQAAVQIFIFTPDSAVTPTNMTEWRVESTLLGIRLVSTQLLSPAPLPCPRPRPGHQRGRLQTVVSSECGHWVCAAQPSLHVSPQLRRCHNKTDHFSCDTIRFLSEAVNQAE